MRRVQTYIKGGLPVDATGNVRTPGYVEDLDISFKSGHSVMFEISVEDKERIEELLVEAYLYERDEY